MNISKISDHLSINKLVGNPAKRFDWVDYAKGIAIILVVYRHIMIGLMRQGLDVPEYYIMANEVVFSFRMPLFFLLSGIFIGKSIVKRSRLGFVKYKFNTILYPYLVWGVIQISIQIIFSNYTNSNRGFIDYLYLIIQPRAIDQFWFLYAMFNVSILYMLLYNIFHGNKLLILVSSLVLHVLSAFVNNVGVLHDALYYFLFIAVGDYMASFITDKTNQGYFASIPLFFLMLPLFIFSQWYWLNYEVNTYVFSLIALYGCFFILAGSFIIDRYGEIALLKIAGYHSLYIYVLHVIISAGVRIFLMNVVGITNVHFLLFSGIFFGTFIPVIIYQLSKLYNLTFLFSLEQVKKKKEFAPHKS